jgi:hypothetical protein
MPSACLVYLTKAGLQCALFIVFLLFFGLPSLAKYLERRTLMVEMVEVTGGVLPLGSLW